MTHFRLLLAISLLCPAVPLLGCTGNSDNQTADAVVDQSDHTPGDDSLPDMADDNTAPPDTIDNDTPSDTAPDLALDSGADSVKDTQEIPDPPELNVCGSEPHSWLPFTEMGNVVLWQEHLLSNLDAEVIAEMVPEGFEYLLPIEYGVRNFMVRYVTQDRGALVEATAIVGIPTGVAPGSSLPVVVFQHGTTGFMDDCAPSKAADDGILPSLVLSTRGWITVSPDYIGMLGFGEKSPAGTIHPYLVGEATAIACLDAVRAAANGLASVEGAPVPDLDKVVLFGGSQGGHAAFFTDLYAPYYAPEFTIIGAVATVPPTDLLAHAKGGCANWGESTISLVAALTAMQKWYGKPADMTSVLTSIEPHNLAQSLPEIMATACGVEDGTFDDVDSPDDVYAAGFLAACASGSWAETDPFGCYLRENSVGTTSVPRISDTPFFVVFGQADTLVITDYERPSIEKLCDMGYDIQYRECAGASHTKASAVAAPMIIQWIAARVAEKPVLTEDFCVIHSAEETCGPSVISLD